MRRRTIALDKTEQRDTDRLVGGRMEVILQMTRMILIVGQDALDEKELHHVQLYVGFRNNEFFVVNWL